MLQFENVSFSYAKKNMLFDGMNLNFASGSIHGLLGLNGAGKTSLLKLAAGALLPCGGQIKAFNYQPHKRQAAFLADIVFVAEDPWLPDLKPEQWLKHYAVFRPKFNTDLFFKLLDDFEIDKSKVISKYSYGQRKKFAIASAIASSANILLLDEPSNGLDIPSKTQLRRVLTQSMDKDRIIIVSTHQVRDLENIIDPIIIVHNGKMLFSIDSSTINEKLSVARVSSLDGLPVVFAQRDAVGWVALLERNSSSSDGHADIETVFNAAVSVPDRLQLVLDGKPLPAYEQSENNTN